MKAILMEAQPALRRKLESLLGELGFEVRCASSEKEALSLEDSARTLWVIGLDPKRLDSLRFLAGALAGRGPKKVIALYPSRRLRGPARNFDDQGFIRRVHQVCPESLC